MTPPKKTFSESVAGLRRPVGRFWPYIRKHRAMTAGSLLALLGEVGLRLLEPWPVAFVVDRVVALPASGERSEPSS